MQTVTLEFKCIAPPYALPPSRSIPKHLYICNNIMHGYQTLPVLPTLVVNRVSPPTHSPRGPQTPTLYTLLGYRPLPQRPH